MVFTLDKRERPLGHCTPKRARQLIEKGRACVYRYYPFTIIIKDVDARKMEVHHDYRIKIDPGAGYTGVSVVEDDRVIAYFELQHRGRDVVDRLQTRKACSRNRKSRETVYRRCKFPRKGVYESPRKKGWLPPSQESILNNVVNFIKRLEKLLGPCRISIELVKFDTQILENPDIKGEEYQHGALYNYELKAYLFEKGVDSATLAEVIRSAMEERKRGVQVLVAQMNKNKKFQKEQLNKEGYTEFLEFYKEDLKR